MRLSRAECGRIAVLDNGASAASEMRAATISAQDIQERYLPAIIGTRVTIFRQDCDLRYLWVENPVDGFLSSRAVGLTDNDILPQQVAQSAISCKQRALNDGREEKFEIVIDGESGPRIFEVSVHPTFDTDGQLSGLDGVAIDVSKERAQSELMQDLIGEVSHRSRNLLSIIQSIAVQMAASEGSLESYRTRFIGRLRSLSRTQDIITEYDWYGAPVSKLIESQCEVIAGICEPVAQTTDLLLTPSSALYFGLAVHELAVCSENHATSCAPDRKVDLAFAKTGETHEFTLQLPTDINGAEKPFDSFSISILERVAPAAVGGYGTLDIGAGHIKYTLQIGEIALGKSGHSTSVL